MIFLLQHPLRQLFAADLELKRLSAVQRQHIRDYRDQYLAQVCQQQGLAAPQIILQAQGKPVCTNLPQLSFNHSHSQQHYALAYSFTGQNIGVDIEDMDRHVRMQDLAKHAFHPDEYRTWQATGFDRQFWFKVWTLKEAILKAHGMGIRISLNTLNTRADAVLNQGSVQHAILGEWHYLSILSVSSTISVAYQLTAAQHRPQLILV